MSNGKVEQLTTTKWVGDVGISEKLTTSEFPTDLILAELQAIRALLEKLSWGRAHEKSEPKV